MVAWFEVYQRRLPSMAGVEQTPCCGQSWIRPAASFSWVFCQRNSPSASLNAMSTPRSFGRSALRRPSLFVPTKTLPPASTGPAYAWEPTSAHHFRFFPVFTSQSPGRPVSSETMLRM